MNFFGFDGFPGMGGMGGGAPKGPVENTYMRFSVFRRIVALTN